MRIVFRQIGLFVGVVAVITTTAQASQPTFALRLAGINGMMFRDMPCTTDSDCPVSSACIPTDVGPPLQSCGFNIQNRCGPAADLGAKCVGGPTPGADCSVATDCGGGTCEVPKMCFDGTTPGKRCTVDGDCGGGTCQNMIKPGDDLGLEVYISRWDEDVTVCEVPIDDRPCTTDADCTPGHCEQNFAQTCTQLSNPCGADGPCIPILCVLAPDPLLGSYQWMMDPASYESITNPTATPMEPSALICSADTPPGTEVCDNLFDDDGDGLVDCADPECRLAEYCACGHGNFSGCKDCHGAACSGTQVNPDGVCPVASTIYIETEKRCDFMFLASAPGINGGFTVAINAPANLFYSLGVAADTGQKRTGMVCVGGAIPGANCEVNADCGTGTCQLREAYSGSLWLHVTDFAGGRYELNFLDNPNFTVAFSGDGPPLPAPLLEPLPVHVADPCEGMVCDQPANVCLESVCENGICSDPRQIACGNCEKCSVLDGGCTPIGACCLPDGTCVEDKTESRCTGPVLQGTWKQQCSTCASVGDQCVGGNGCPDAVIDWAGGDPPDGVIDARQPRDVANPAALQGIDTIVVSGDQGAGTDVTACWQLCESVEEGSPNAVTGVVENPPGTYTVTLARRITPGAITLITYQPDVGTPSTGTFTSLPADSDASGTSEIADLATHIDCCLNNGCIPTFGEFSCDINHSGGGVSSEDTLRLLDLLNGAGAFVVEWNGETAVPGCP